VSAGACGAESLARETQRRDRSQIGPLATAAPRRTGREVERAAVLERREASKELVPAKASVPAAWVAPDPDLLGVIRRQLLNRGIINFFGLALTAFGASTLGFLWPQQGGGFGSKINIGSLSDVELKVAEGDGFAYYPEGRLWVTLYPKSALPKPRVVYGSSPGVIAGMEAGVAALYQKCPHLGCRVPECKTSQWFECPCHGSQYNQVGEKKGGPAPRGLDRFPVDASGSSLVVDTGTIVQGPAIGTNTSGQEAEGPHCITGAGEH
jgi:cytochrome b6-f complex iron-sulfur subunit